MKNDLFKEYDSSSSESGDEANKRGFDGDMMFDQANLMPLSKKIFVPDNCYYRTTSGDIDRRTDVEHERVLGESEQV